MTQRADMTIRFPETARDAAVLLVEQMWTAITNGEVVPASDRLRPGLEGWLSSAAEVLAKVEDGRSR